MTDILPNQTNLTVPVYANYCSGICYEKGDQAALDILERCPYGGDQHDIPPGIQRFFG